MLFVLCAHSVSTVVNSAITNVWHYIHRAGSIPRIEFGYIILTTVFFNEISCFQEEHDIFYIKLMERRVSAP